MKAYIAVTRFFWLMLPVFLAACSATPYYGRAVVEAPSGEPVCGVHGTPVKAHKGYHFSGSISGTTAYEYAARCYPNILGPGYSSTYDKKWGHTLPYTDYTCTKCEAEAERIAKWPHWYVERVARHAQANRDSELERAAQKAKRTGNPADAALPDGDGTVSRVL